MSHFGLVGCIVAVFQPHAQQVCDRPGRIRRKGRSLCFRLGFFLRSGLFRLFRHFLIIALGGVFRVQLFSYRGRFYRVRCERRREHANHQHQRQKQRKHSSLHIRVPLLSFVLCGTAYAQFRKLSSIVYHIRPEFPVPASFFPVVFVKSRFLLFFSSLFQFSAKSAA